MGSDIAESFFSHGGTEGHHLPPPYLPCLIIYHITSPCKQIKQDNIMAKLLLIQLSSYFVFGKEEIVDYYLWSWIRLTILAEMVLMIVF